MVKKNKVRILDEGDWFCTFLNKRLIKNNQNVLGVNLGATGSGKSYRDLRLAELWYQKHFKKPFPPENICFGVGYTMNLLNKALREGTLKRGEILIFEEAGVSMGSLDFQNKISKMFNYILQSFRTMNIAILFNLPYMSMLNKSTRMLLHYSMESLSIDRVKEINYCKPFIHQVNQSTGKVYKKYPRIIRGGKPIKISALGLQLPNKELCKVYEAKKIDYLTETTQGFSDKLEEIEKEGIRREGRKGLTPKQQVVFNYTQEGKKQSEIAEILGISQGSVSDCIQFIRKKGYEPKINSNPLKTRVLGF